MYQSLKYKIVKIRKPRTCWGCQAQHDIGHLMHYSVSVYDKELSTSYWCEVCDAFINKGGDYSDGIGKYEFKYETEYKEFKNSYLCPTRKVLIEKVESLNQMLKQIDKMFN